MNPEQNHFNNSNQVGNTNIPNNQVLTNNRNLNNSINQNEMNPSFASDSMLTPTDGGNTDSALENHMINNSSSSNLTNQSNRFIPSSMNESEIDHQAALNWENVSMPKNFSSFGNIPPSTNEQKRDVHINNQPNPVPNVDLMTSPNREGDFERQSGNVINDQELLKAFIGFNYEKITTRAFNWSGFFFTYSYVLYRKMFLYWLLLQLFDLILLNNIIATLIIGVIFGLAVNPVYLAFAKRKIKEIKAKNPNKSMGELKTICAIKGGTSIGVVLLLIISRVFIIIGILYIMASALT